MFQKVLRILSLNNLRRYEAWVRHQVGDCFFQDDNYRILLTTALSFKVEVMIYCPLPDPLRSGYFLCCYMSESYAFCQNLFFCHFWRRKRKSLVKPIDTSLRSSAIPFFLSFLFLRSPFHMENKECTILCMVSRFLAALADLRFILSCRRLQPSACFLSTSGRVPASSTPVCLSSDCSHTASFQRSVRRTTSLPCRIHILFR